MFGSLKKIFVDWEVPDGNGTFRRVAYELDAPTRAQFVRDLTESGVSGMGGGSKGAVQEAKGPFCFITGGCFGNARASSSP